MTPGERLAVWVAGLLLAVLGLGLALLPLETPPFTAALSERFSRTEEAGLTAEQTARLAEQVRAFVVAGRGALPAIYAGAPAFDASAVSHLRDVREVIAGAHVATAVIGLLASVVGVVAWRSGRRRLVGAALIRGGAILGTAVVVIAVLAVTSFDAFFSAFHGVFFAAGTWTFPYDSLLIRLFPEGFWATAGAIWGVVALIVATAFALVGRGIERRFGR